MRLGVTEMPTLYLMRHAKSDWHSSTSSDFDRPLNQRGAKDAVRMGQWLQQQTVIPGLILSSPAERAKQTALAVVDALQMNAEQIQFNKDLYHADRATLLQVLHSVPEQTESVLLVAHNPGLDELAEWLAPEPPALTQSGKLMTTAAIAIFEIPGAWSKLQRGTVALRQLVRPRELT
jgi:phosphohistidine phosphatase